jgi:hypothetical protein
MRTQQVPDHARNAPVHALRAVFSGVGQLFLAADRLKRQDGEAGQAQARWRSLDQTGNVRLLTAEDLAEEFGDAGPAAPAAYAEPEPTIFSPEPPASSEPSAFADPEPPAFAEPEPEPEPPIVAESESESESGPQSESGPEPLAAHAAGASLPLENYDELSVPSLRARLRGLDAGQVAELAAYERAHAARADVVTMFERRVEKLTAAR